MSLPITARQINALRALQVEAPELAKLASSIALAFDASGLENPHMVRLIIEPPEAASWLISLAVTKPT